MRANLPTFEYIVHQTNEWAAPKSGSTCINPWMASTGTIQTSESASTALTPGPKT